MLTEKIKADFLAILEEELIPAMGCTEPIALAYAAARGREVLGHTPEWIVARCSGNMIKNVRCVRIPNSGGLTGIEAACALGALAGDPSRNMEVLEAVTDEGRSATLTFLKEERCSVEFLDSPEPLHFIIELYGGNETASVEVRHSHLGVVRLKKNGEVLFSAAGDSDPTERADRSELSVEHIHAFAEEIDLPLITPYTEKQIACNLAIAERGMRGDYGIGIGPAVLAAYEGNPFAKMRAYAAAASEARMEGCDLPVIITSGSGNQGITSTVPIVVFAREKGLSEERLSRGLVFSSLMTVYQKEYIGKLSAFCGAVSAACAAGAALTYLSGGTLAQINDTVDNTLANVPGIICDGAKASCAAKISSALDAAFFAHLLAMQGKAYASNTGILREDTAETIRGVGHIGRVGMEPTDKEIVKLMIQ